ncbi:hypothetical protein RM533_00220 [Croceicoccus sp. F390]|uniref:Uncharacterized protein n=1 Tax=Croceicoccus esteveae TaxID=3075597 RepID=A0ABU2ZDC2_9SPHN|nr:hypothetical protein [Croceicoccus sp. F390]MDT0574602.1 hypothetical protein [Croceicoccus sp. F390]
MGLIRLGVLGALGYAGYKYFTNKHDEPAAFAKGEPGGMSNSATTPVRNAGASSMRDKPDSWSKTDQAMDESFPASDPPATY